MTVAPDRYLDTASVGLAARLPLGRRVGGPEAQVAVREPRGIAFVYAPNATSVIRHVAEFLRRTGRGRPRQSSLARAHPVVGAALADDATRSRRTGYELITTVNGDDGTLRVPTDALAGVLCIHDAVQAFGLLSLSELGILWQRVRAGQVVIGCIHKFIGSPVPVGFAALPRRWLTSDAAGRTFLAARDYLGDAVGTRPGFDGFPDTFSASLATVVSPFLRIAIGSDRSALASLRDIIAVNRAALLAAVLESPFEDFVLARDARGIIGLVGPKRPLAALSRRLTDAGFLHTQRGAHDATLMLRLSAPTVPMRSKTLDEFRRCLGVGSPC